MTTHVAAIFDRNKTRYIAEWKELLRFPSISADPGHRRDGEACAKWLVAHTRRIGFKSRLLRTAGGPVVYGERQGDPAQPVVLFYGHYDVQPVDPLELWTTPPFEPCLRHGREGQRMYARGASDNKGQVFYSLKAMEALIQQEEACRERALPTIRLVIEGEEESVCVGLPQALRRWPELFKADILMVADTGMAAGGVPAITVGLRGIIQATIVLTGAKEDLHSGLHGGAAPNAAHGMARLIASLHHPSGRMAVAGLYADAPEPTARERKMANAAPMDPTLYESRTGVKPLAGEKKFTVPERIGLRPCLDINGVHSGYGGAGGKTIIPGSAMAKISARLVAGQDPKRCLRELVSHLKKNVPPGFGLEITETGAGAPGVRLDPASPLATKAKQVLDQLTPHPAVYHWMGGSIPIVAKLAAVSGAQPLMVGFSGESDSIHAPNESFSLEQFRMGFMYTAMILPML